MGKVSVRMKAVVYGLSPFQQKVMPDLWKDLPTKIHHKISKNWHNTIFTLGPIVRIYAYVQNYEEKEKLEHRF
ncbi:PREDICTED: cytochrome b-c1 complex subunit 8-like [Fragaria vesca subsp. vesca]|uniref:cytochrome b-c1 complex subunit 8-like n=1 Tax=Fragaria vesca subsp. vesca TaxID=101020 RepID=UPI0002C30746|nr:PREDICTED: cytochrome b-c1 complex subunit 8-like [Fragaria vesca subsp. vesca]